MNNQAMFAAGCFWGVQDAFDALKDRGVIETAVGYAGGHFENPTYQDVVRGKTGHREVVLVMYDPNQISYETLLDVFWDCHDPSYPNDGGEAIDIQYKSAIFYFNEAQKEAAERSKQAIIDQKRFAGIVVTDILSDAHFYRAEDVHQNFNHKQERVCSIKKRISGN